MIGGFVLGKLNLEKHLSPWVQQVLLNAQKETDLEIDKQSFVQRLPLIFREAMGIIKSVILFVVIGIGIGALMHGFIPTGF